MLINIQINIILIKVKPDIKFVFYRPFRLYDPQNENSWHRVKHLDKGQVYIQVGKSMLKEIV
jgi:hypothetical protein